jgi:hypothetical protein
MDEAFGTHRMLVTGERHLRLALSEYTDHYYSHPAHRALQQSRLPGVPSTCVKRERPGFYVGTGSLT